MLKFLKNNLTSKWVFITSKLDENNLNLDENNISWQHCPEDPVEHMITTKSNKQSRTLAELSS